MAHAQCQAPQDRGILVAVEGIDGSGKATLSAAICELLSSTRPSEVIASPGYERTQAGRLIGRYLNGDLVLADDSPYTVAMLFATDRQETLGQVHHLLQSGINVIVDRYVFSNAAYQGARAAEPELVRTWILDLEFGRLNCPIADLNVLIDIPPERARALVAQKAQRSYTANELDRYEANDALLARVARQYEALAASVDFGRWLTLRPDVGGRLTAPKILAEEVMTALRS